MSGTQFSVAKTNHYENLNVVPDTAAAALAPMVDGCLSAATTTKITLKLAGTAGPRVDLTLFSIVLFRDFALTAVASDADLLTLDALNCPSTSTE